MYGRTASAYHVRHTVDDMRGTIYDEGRLRTTNRIIICTVHSSLVSGYNVQEYDIQNTCIWHSTTYIRMSCKMFFLAFVRGKLCCSPSQRPFIKNLRYSQEIVALKSYSIIMNIVYFCKSEVMNESCTVGK
jgi:hypothetical protein